MYNIPQYTESLAYLQSHKDEYADFVVACFVNCVTLQHTDVLFDTLAILACQGWEKEENADHAGAALPRLSEVPLPVVC